MDAPTLPEHLRGPRESWHPLHRLVTTRCPTCPEGHRTKVEGWERVEGASPVWLRALSRGSGLRQLLPAQRLVNALQEVLLREPGPTPS